MRGYIILCCAVCARATCNASNVLPDEGITSVIIVDSIDQSQDNTNSNTHKRKPPDALVPSKASPGSAPPTGALPLILVKLQGSETDPAPAPALNSIPHCARACTSLCARACTHCARLKGPDQNEWLKFVQSAGVNV
jgi:hypothetical protein